jgi:hypothetical protein
VAIAGDLRWEGSSSILSKAVSSAPANSQAHPSPPLYAYQTDDLPDLLYPFESFSRDPIVSFRFHHLLSKTVHQEPRHRYLPSATRLHTVTACQRNRTLDFLVKSSIGHLHSSQMGHQCPACRPILLVRPPFSLLPSPRAAPRPRSGIIHRLQVKTITPRWRFPMAEDR